MIFYKFSTRKPIVFRLGINGVCKKLLTGGKNIIYNKKGSNNTYFASGQAITSCIIAGM